VLVFEHVPVFHATIGNVLILGPEFRLAIAVFAEIGF
jgi:hypothetical protein